MIIKAALDKSEYDKEKLDFWKKTMGREHGLDGAIEGAVVGSTIGAGIGAGHQALKNRKLAPEDKKSLRRAALKGGAIGGGAGAIGMGALTRHGARKQVDSMYQKGEQGRRFINSLAAYEMKEKRT